METWGGPQDPEPFLSKLEAISSKPRYQIIQQLRTSKILKEIEVHKPTEDGPPRPLARQTVKQHLERLIEVGIVTTREAERRYGPTVEYVLNHQELFRIAEAFRELARLRPEDEPGGETLKRPPPAESLGEAQRALVLVKGVDVGQAFPLDPREDGPERWIIGRRRGLAVPLDFDPFVSAENAVVERRGDRFVLEDLPESRNGTWVNFRQLEAGEAFELSHGDLVGVGQSLLMFRG